VSMCKEIHLNSQQKPPTDWWLFLSFPSLRPTDIRQCWTRAKRSSPRDRALMSLAEEKRTWRLIGCSLMTSTTLVRNLGTWVCGR
jgi:hypothetical protein